MSKKNDIKDELNSLKALKDKLATITDFSEREKIIEEILKLEEKTEENNFDDMSLEEKIEEAEKQLKEDIDKYDEKYKELEKVKEEENSKLNSDKLLSKEEIKNITEEISNRKLKINEESVKIKIDLDRQRSLIESYNRKKDINNSKEDINTDEDIQVLYSLNDYYMNNETPRLIKIDSSELNSIISNSEILPTRIIGNVSKEYVPGKAPSDLVEEDKEENVINENVMEDIVIDSTSNNDEVERSLEEIVNYLDVSDKDSSVCKATNINVSEKIVDELKAGEYLYNIIHLGIDTLNVPIDMVKSSYDRVMDSKHGKTVMTEFKKRIDSLSNNDLEVLFDEYNGSNINPLLSDKLSKLNTKQFEEIEEDIKINYDKLYNYLGKLSVVEQALVGVDNDQLKYKFTMQRRNILDKAAVCVEVIENDRDEVFGELSDVPSNLKYLNVRNKNIDDSGLLRRIGFHRAGLNIARTINDSEGIVDNFMGLEKCYYENNEDVSSIFGKRSIGSKYYLPVSEQFNYCNDMFLANLIATSTLVSADYVDEKDESLDEVIERIDGVTNNYMNGNGTIMDQIKAIDDLVTIQNDNVDSLSSVASDVSTKIAVVMSEEFQRGSFRDPREDAIQAMMNSYSEYKREVANSPVTK